MGQNDEDTSTPLLDALGADGEPPIVAQILPPAPVPFWREARFWTSLGLVVVLLVQRWSGIEILPEEMLLAAQPAQFLPVRTLLGRKPRE